MYNCWEWRIHREHIGVIIQAWISSDDLLEQFDQLFIHNFYVAEGTFCALLWVVCATKGIRKLIPRRLVQPARVDNLFFEISSSFIPFSQDVAIPARVRLLCLGLLFKASMSNRNHG